jgi:hypothetical protein
MRQGSAPADDRKPVHRLDDPALRQDRFSRRTSGIGEAGEAIPPAGAVLPAVSAAHDPVRGSRGWKARRPLAISGHAGFHRRAGRRRISSGRPHENSWRVTGVAHGRGPRAHQRPARGVDAGSGLSRDLVDRKPGADSRRDHLGIRRAVSPWRSRIAVSDGAGRVADPRALMVLGPAQQVGGLAPKPSASPGSRATPWGHAPFSPNFCCAPQRR